MRTAEFNKHLIICMYCGVGRVKRMGQRCDNCKKKIESDRSEGSVIGSRQPSVILDVDGKKVFVDKTGKEIYNHGYDLEGDHHGWVKNGYKKPRREFI